MYMSESCLKFREKRTYLFVLVGMLQETEVSDGCEAFQKSEWVIRGNVLLLGGAAVVQNETLGLRTFGNEALTP